METPTRPRYVVITPVRDEAQHIEQMMACVAAQTIRPIEWVIVDDGSTDGTQEIVAQYARKHAWVSLVCRGNRGFRDPDVGAIGAFVEGYQALGSNDWDFVVNLDADLGLDPRYFEKCFEKFRQDPKLGIAGGTLYHFSPAGEIVVEVAPPGHVRGATKIYRRACWQAIGGLALVPGWDTLDEIRASMTGWSVRSFPEFRVLHRRPTGQVGGGWRDAVKNGRSDYYLGYHPLFMLAKCLRRLFRKPYFVDGAGHLAGFVSGYVNRRPQLADRNTIRYLRRQQMVRLLSFHQAAMNSQTTQAEES